MRAATRQAMSAIGILALLLSLLPGRVAAHAFPERFDPPVGAVLTTAPTQVRIWFDGDLEPAFSTIIVTDSAGQHVDQGNAQVDPKNRRLLAVTLTALPPGVYKVVWRVLAVDGHRTQGDFRFTLKPAQ